MRHQKKKKKAAVLLAAIVALSGCSEDEGGGPPPPQPGGAPAAPPPPAAAAPAAANPNNKKKIEDLVSTEEESSIRHVFRDRDFNLDENNRDPFQSFVLASPDMKGSETLKKDVTSTCTREDQFVAPSYSYTDLRLVGIVTERTQKKVLMMGGNFGYTIKKGDCVGREKAVVKDIGTGYVTFQVQPEIVGGQQREVEEHSVELYPNQVPLTSQPRVFDTPRTTAPVVAPGQQGSVPVQSPTTSPSSVPVVPPQQ